VLGHRQVVGAVDHADQHALAGAAGDVERVEPHAEPADHAQFWRTGEQLGIHLLQPHHDAVGIADHGGQLLLQRRAAEFLGQHGQLDVGPRLQQCHGGGVQGAAQDDFVHYGRFRSRVRYAGGMLAPSDRRR